MNDGRRRTSDGVDPVPAGRGAARDARTEPYYPPRGQPLRAPWDPAEGTPGRRRSVPGSRDHLRKQTVIGRFFATWGWRAYAIPVLVVLTALVIADAVVGAGPDEPSTDPGSEQPPAVISGPIPGEVPASGQLPEGGPFVEAGTGEFRVVAGETGLVGRPTAERFTYTVDVEEGVDSVEFGGDDAVARMVDATLANPKSWTADGAAAFQRVEGEEPTFRVSLATPMTVREYCGYDIALEASCYNSSTGRVYLNLARWVRGAQAFQGDIGSYRQYVVNHEVGHAVGHPQHEVCPSDGALAPIMMQQTFGVDNSDIHRLDPDGVVPDNGDTCRYNAWPFPDGPPEQG